MAKLKRPKRPEEPYRVFDADGEPTRFCKTLTEARRGCADDNRFHAYDAPHRIYVLVTLEEQRVIRAAEAACKGAGWGKGANGMEFRYPAFKAMNRLVKAVEAACGK